ncbi:UDP-N-acetylmuramoyl-tripeptide--D-alanyl-D-alanine ligase [Thiosulfativibrio zosterae]|uniref:UDP-N-acetylmuramoyl-tripeptide--D-alanyl-D-alanine ligase n=1 Tax=Thiosulfativibrio zosterae TaxID=2675053 RepID=A0A6F8PLI5_9GAMM|nr:UDP-N-acetylmuramoyl-tripeptide--D-alanyl-D-alanine ligase [Thiosulfativibrio zosterae]BBP42907.1 UDP-N-acetylmuramoyl-tripeptide--D-alanyl-D-alanine ligase [Thiosulfativibrio zosterae]
MTWTLKQLSDAVKGQVISASADAESITFERMITDSRQIQDGDCYVALQGQKFDGHDFIPQAIKHGVAVILASNPEVAQHLDIPVVLVSDTRIALGQFAAWHRLQCPLKTLFAITGSNGKTTCKTMLHSVLAHLGHTLATEGNLNNDYGVPRTLLNIQPSHDYAVIEMGANHGGEIQYLTHLAQPNVAMITQASKAHLEGFGSLQGVINTKGEIFEGLLPGGKAIINLDSPGSEQWLASCQALDRQVLSFGRSEQADVRVLKVTQNDIGIQVDLKLPDQSQVQVQLSVLGPHNAMNVAGVIACGWAAGLNWAQIQPGLVNFRAVSGRLMTYPLKQGVLIDDSYNANPTSVKAGIDTLMGLNGQHLVCLGSMAELGEQSLAAHQSVIDYAMNAGVESIFVMGAGYAECQSNDAKVQWFASHDAMIEAAQNTIQQNVEIKMNILVKGSRSAGMEVVSQTLISNNKQTHNG